MYRLHCNVFQGDILKTVNLIILGKLLVEIYQPTDPASYCLAYCSVNYLDQFYICLYQA